MSIWAVLLLGALLPMARTANAQATLTVTGTSDGVAFQVSVTPTSLLTNTVTQTFSLQNVTVPSGRACTPGECQVGYDAPGGIIRITTNPVDVPNNATTVQSTFNFAFPQYIHSGVYAAAGGGGFDAGTLIVSGIDATGGAPQTNATGAGFAFPLQVTATTPTPNPAGVAVTFAAPVTGASATFPGGSNPATTNSAGQATITPTANGTAGVYLITASAMVNSVAVQTVFLATNLNIANASGVCVVTTGADDLSAGSLRSQVATCGKGGTITFHPSVTSVTLAQFQDIQLTQDLTIDGGGTVTINGNSTRVFFVSGGTVTLKNLILNGGSAAGGAGGDGSSGGGGGAAGMGGAIFLNGGSLTVDTVTFTNNTANGGNGGTTATGSAGGGGGVGGPGGTTANDGGNGGGGADFGNVGGAGGSTGSDASGAGGGGGAALIAIGGGGGFGGGGAAGEAGGPGGFGGGGGGMANGGTFAGEGSNASGGGGGAGLGGAIFANTGTLQLINTTFTSNTATGGTGAGGSLAGAGQGKGGAIFINSTATATYSGGAPVFGASSASSAGAGTLCNTVLGVTAQDTSNVCGTLGPGAATHFSVTAPSTAIAGTAFGVTVTALDSLNNTATGYTGTVHFTTTDTAGVLPSDYAFTMVDAGVHTFANGFGLSTPGGNTITATDTVTGTITGTSGTITVSAAPPTISASFSPTTVQAGGTQTTTLTFTVTNPNSVSTLTGIAYSNTYPTGLVVDIISLDGCTTGSRSFTGTGITISNVSLAAGASCTEAVRLHATGTGLFTDSTSTVTATGAAPGLSASATLTVNADAPPTITDSFTPNSIAFNGTSSLSFTIANPNTTISLSGIGFSDNFPAGVLVSTPNALAGSCGGGTITAVAGSGSLSLSGATLAASAQCTFSINVAGATAGAKVNTTGNVTSTEGGTGLTATATLTVAQAPATHFSVSAPGAATAGTSFAVTVTALDASNSTATAYSGTAHFTSSDGLAVLPADTTLTNGVGTFAVTLKTAGTQTVTATDTVSSITGASGNITVSPAATSHFSVVAPGAETAGTSFSFTVTALDAFNNTTTGYSGTVAFTSTDAQASLPGNMTLTNGTGTFSATLKTAGSQTITATDTVTVGITGTSANIVIAAASGMSLSVSAPASVTAGASFSVSVTAIDQFGNTASSYVGTVHFTSSDATAVLPADATLTNGAGTFAATLKTAGNQTITATDTVTASIHGSSNTITVAGAAATHLSVAAPGSATAGTSFGFTVTALDQFNNTSAGYGGTVHFTSSDATATLPIDLTLTNGTANLSATLKTEGVQTITATDTVTVGIHGTSGNITVNPAAAAHFLLVAPGAATAGTPLSFTVTAQDAFNNLVAGYAGTIHFTSTDGIAVLPANSTLTNGTGTFSATLKTAGVQTITATDTVSPGFTGVSSGVTVSPAAATHFTVTAPGAATAGIALNFTVTALDQFSNTATGYVGTVHFTSSDSIAALPADATLTNGAGTLAATLKTAANQTLSATDTVTGSITGTSGTVVVSAAAVSHLTVMGPTSATVGVGTSFTVRAGDAFDNTATSYAGTVHFTSTDGAATLPANSTLTNGTGSFNATLQTPGLQKITATDTVTVGITGTSGNISVVIPPPPFAVSPNIVTLQYAQGSTPPSPIQTFTVSANGSYVPYSVQSSQPWLVIPANGTTSTAFGVNLDPTNLTPGTYTATLTFSSTNGTAQASVTLTVMPPPTLAVQPGSLRLSGTAGSSALTPAPVQLTSSNTTTAFTVTSNAPWLTVSASSTSTPATLTITANPANLIGGTYQGAITVTSPGAANSPLTIPVTYLLSGASNTGVDNSASFQPGPVAPNTIMALFDALGCGAGTQVTVNGIMAQVLFANANQINFATPNNIGTSGTAAIQTMCNGNSSGTITLPLGPVDPGIYTEAGTGTGEASIVNSNGTVNTAANPISRGDSISVYVTGFGPYNPVGADGLTRVQFPVMVTIGGVPAGVLYAGAAPTETSGLQQINVLVPGSVQPGSNVPIVLTVDGVSAQGGVTVAVQ